VQGILAKGESFGSCGGGHGTARFETSSVAIISADSPDGRAGKAWVSDLKGKRYTASSAKEQKAGRGIFIILIQGVR
jgi:hypothetical protein